MTGGNHEIHPKRKEGLPGSSSQGGPGSQGHILAEGSYRPRQVSSSDLRTEAFRTLLLMADPSEESVSRYVSHCRALAFFADADNPVALILYGRPASLLSRDTADSLDSRTTTGSRNSRTSGGSLNSRTTAAQDSQDSTVEIHNLAVLPAFRGRGLASRLITCVLEENREKTIRVCTGSTSFHALSVYQRSGFRIVEVDKDYFARNYCEPIFENGILLLDRLVLEWTVDAAWTEKVSVHQTPPRYTDH